MSSYFQETAIGQIARFVTGNKVFHYPEEEPDFQIPWEQVQATEKMDEIKSPAQLGNSDSSSSDDTPQHTPAVDEKSDSIARPNDDPEQGLNTIPTQASAARIFTNATARIKSREQTRQYTAERFAVEQQETLERHQSSVIVPQKTAGGITLVDWYTTDDPANPQNWSSWYKTFVTFIIFMYTFGVYASSAIYTPATEQVMSKFGVSIAQASLGLSLYVIGYGVGPLVSH